MSAVFRTANGSPYDVEIAGVGRLAGNGQGGIPVSRAANYVRELQDESGQPLSGSKLTAAANAFAKDRGIAVDNVRGDVDEEKLRVDAGAFPAGPTIEELSAEASARDQAAVPASELALNPNPEVSEVEAPAPRDLPTSDSVEEAN